MKYLGMDQLTGKRITELEHVRQSIRDILLTPVGSRVARREYGSLLPELIDWPQNDAVKLQVMAASYTAISRWEPRIQLQSIQINTGMDGAMTVELSGVRTDGNPASLSVPLGGHD
ncbi:GPW/gp25 family protein [Hafnia paralvei]|uniref:GPW/gp25 family protein n=1 Tax=Hafnia paralvei TaxID=546367 RepID=UPI0029DC47F9|nr:GPW/gp25 family protein [Hafnia paralvei]MDX6912264.1 GPW/gp25 family protein [Hafnia paralvei]